MIKQVIGKVVPEKGIDYFTEEDIKSLNIPKNTSDLTNDSNFITNDDVPTKLSELTNDDHTVKDETYTHTDNNYTNDDKAKVDKVAVNGDGNSYLSNDGTYKEVKGITDYNELENKPFIQMTGTEQSPISLRTLQTGAYVLTGICTPYVGSDTYMQANNAITYVNWFETVTAVQIFYPPYNQVQYFEVYDDNYTTNTVGLNNLATNDYVNNLVGNIDSLLDSVNGEVI